MVAAAAGAELFKGGAGLRFSDSVHRQSVPPSSCEQRQASTGVAVPGQGC